MGYAKYVGRVGALAVALGFGAAVATTTPAIAFADGTEPDPNVGTNQPNEAQPDPAPNPGPDPTPPPPAEQAPPGENNQQQNNNGNVETTPSGGEVRTAEPGVVLNTGGYQEEEKQLEEKTPDPTGTTPPPPPPPPVVYVPPTPPAVTPKDQVIPPTAIDEKGKSKDAQLQQESDNKLKTTLNDELSRNSIEKGNGAQLRVTSLDENAEAFDANAVMTMFSTNENDNQQGMQTMAAAAAPAAPRPSLVSVFTGFLALVGLGPSTGAGTPSFPFVPQPIFDAIFAFVRRIESTLSNQTPTATVIPRQDPTNGQVTGQVKGADEDGDTLTYAVSSEPAHGQVTLNPKTGAFTYTPDNLDDTDPTTWKRDSFKITVSDNSGFHIHPQGESHTTEVTVNVLPPQAPTNPPASDGTVAGQITGVNNPSGGPMTYVVQPQPGSTEQLNVTPTGTYTYKPSTPLAHGAAFDANNDGEPDNPVFQTFTVIATDQDGNQTPIVLKLPVTPSNADPVPLAPEQQPAPQPTPSGGYSGTIGVNPDPDGDPVKIVSAVASDGTPVTFNGLNWTYGEPSGARAAEPQGFATFAAMRSFVAPDEDNSAELSDTGFSTLAADEPVTITFTLSDGHGGVVPYTVTLPAADEAPVDVSATGAPQGPAIVDASRDRAYQISYVKSANDNPQLQQYSGTTYVTVIDTGTGEAIGETISMPGAVDRTALPAVISGDTSHVFFTTKSYDATAGSYTTYVAAVDAETGELIDNDGGAPADNKLVELSGRSNAFNGGRLLLHGNRVYAVTQETDPATGSQLNHVAVIDAESGQLMSSPFTFNGQRTGEQEIVFSGDRAYLVGHDWTTDSTADKTNVAVINTTTGQLVDVVSADGQPMGNLVVDDSTGRAYMTTLRFTPEGPKTWVNVIDTEDGSLVDSPIEIDGIGIHSVVLNRDGSRAYQLSHNGESGAGGASTITVINTTTGARDGTDIDVDVPGGVGGDLVLDGNTAGTEHAYVTTINPDQQHATITVIDTETRAVVDQLNDINGYPPRGPVLSDNGKTVYQVFTGTDPDTGAFVTRVAVFDTVTGTAIGGQPIEIAGGQADEVQEVGDRLYVQTVQHNVNDPDNFEDDTDTSRVAVINTQTGQIMGGGPFETEGYIVGDVIVNGNRAYQRTKDEQQQITRITVINTDTGQRVGAAPITVDGLVADNVSESPYVVGGDALLFGENDRAYQVTQFDNGDGTFTMRLAVIDTNSGALLNAEPVAINQIPTNVFFQVADDGRAYLTVLSTDNPSSPLGNRKVTVVTVNSDTGEIVGDPLIKDGFGFLVNDQGGQPRYLLSLTQDFSGGFGGAKDVTFTPLAGGDSIVVPGSAVAYATSPDGTLAYVVTDGTDDSTITVVDLERGQIVATSSTVPGHAGIAFTPPFTLDAQGGFVFGADGKGYITTWIKNPEDGSYTTQVTGLPGLEPTSTLMSFRDLSVVYPDDEKDKSAPLQPGPTMVDTGNAGEFDVNSTGPMALLAV